MKLGAKTSACIKELQAVCDRYDVGAVINIADRNEAAMCLRTPSWSKWTMEDDGQEGLASMIAVDTSEETEDTIRYMSFFFERATWLRGAIGKSLELLHRTLKEQEEKARKEKH